MTEMMGLEARVDNRASLLTLTMHLTRIEKRAQVTPFASSLPSLSVSPRFSLVGMNRR